MRVVRVEGDGLGGVMKVAGGNDGVGVVPPILMNVVDARDLRPCVSCDQLHRLPDG